MPRYDDRYGGDRYGGDRYGDRYGGTRLYVGHLSSRTRARDLEDLFSRYGRGEVSYPSVLSHDGLTVSGNRFRRVRDVDLKHDFAFVDFSDPRDADDARYTLNGRQFDGSRIIVEFAKGGPRGSGGSREYLGRGPPPGSGRCFNCGIDGHWARDCKAGDWKNKCYRCGERGHIERNCQNSPKPLKRGRSYSRSPSRSPPRRGRSRSYSRSYSRSRSPVRRERSVERDVRRSRSPRYSRSPKLNKSSPPSKGRKRSPTPEDNSPQERGSPLNDRIEEEARDGTDYSDSPRRGKSMSPSPDRGESSPDRRYRSPEQTNGHSRSPSPDDDRSPIDDDDDDRRGPRRGSESPSSAQD